MTTRAEIYDAVRKAKNRGIHNFSLGTFQTYWHLDDLPPENIEWHSPRIVTLRGLPGGTRQKAFVFKADMRDKDLLPDIQRQMIVYSIDALPLPQHMNFKEVAYDLGKVFDPTSYGKQRKYRQRVENPLLAVNDELKFGHLSASDMYDVMRLHDEWARWKLSDPKLMKMMFPKARYLRCCKLAAAHPDYYMLYGLRWKGRLVSVRAVYVEDETAFGLAFFSAAWIEDAPRFSTILAINSMLDLKERGFKTLNCGASLNPKLETFKSHWPLDVVQSHYYSRLKTGGP